MVFVHPSWRQIQLQNFTSWEKLATFLDWDTSWHESVLVHPSFPLNLPLRLARKIKKNTWTDPILKQFLPLQTELEKKSLFVQDPVQDAQFVKEAKLLQKYQGRALLLVSSACVMNCRFCFRRNFPYEKEKKGFANELQIIKKDSSLQEIILSGGDPLSLGNQELFSLLRSLEAISHIKRIRFHTRFPIGIPERIDEGLLAFLSSYSKQVFFCLHINHPKELDEELFAYIRCLQRLAIPVLSQTVLLQGVNDSLPVLQELFETLVNHGILPYYLHQLDKVEGAHHFAVLEERGKQLMQELQSTLSGYAVPKYVKEVPGASSKTSISFS